MININADIYFYLVFFEQHFIHFIIIIFRLILYLKYFINSPVAKSFAPFFFLEFFKNLHLFYLNANLIIIYAIIICIIFDLVQLSQLFIYILVLFNFIMNLYLIYYFFINKIHNSLKCVIRVLLRIEVIFFLNYNSVKLNIK